jgi:hypothetical protein
METGQGESRFAFYRDKLLVAALDRLKPVKKFAFLVHEPMMLDHYAGVWKAMGSARFAIVLTEHFYLDETGAEKKGVASFLAHVHGAGYEVLHIKHVLTRGISFPYVVTNHVIAGSTADRKPAVQEDVARKRRNRLLACRGQPPECEFGVDLQTYLPLQIGRRQIRYMYGADLSDAWSLQPWNAIYDLFLCHGVRDEKIISQRFPGKTFIMGYPRYDDFFRPDLDLTRVKEEFGVVDGRKTLLWMPTLGGTGSSIPVFAEALAKLSGPFNVIVRPHPLSFVQEPELIAELERLAFRIDRNATRNMNELFKVADVVLGDYGGTPFSAIFLGKNLVMLDVPGADALPINADSTVLELKKSLPVIGPQDVGSLAGMLDSEVFAEANRKTVDELFGTYFGGPRGGGSARLSDYLQHIDDVMTPERRSE